MSTEAAAATQRPLRILRGGLVALLIGLALAYLDTRPNWDDTGISAGLLFIGAAAGGQLGAPWFLAAALAVAPLLVAELADNLGLLLTLPIALAGGITGAFLRRLTQRS